MLTKIKKNFARIDLSKTLATTQKRYLFFPSLQFRFPSGSCSNPSQNDNKYENETLCPLIPPNPSDPHKKKPFFFAVWKRLAPREGLSDSLRTAPPCVVEDSPSGLPRGTARRVLEFLSRLFQTQMGETSFGFSSFNGFSQSFGFNALVLDGGKGELVRAPVGPPVVTGKKGTPAAVAAALKSHSEAERRRRERINSHLTTLRSLVPCSDKMDKASLLAKVITHVKDLKRHATEISKGCPVPSDTDEVRVEPDEDGMHVNNGIFLIRASLCCEDRPDLLEDLKQTLANLPLKTLRAEISTLGGRVRNMFVMATEGKVTEIERHLIVSSAHQALKSVLDRVASPEFSPRSSLSCKRRRISSFDSLSSSS